MSSKQPDEREEQLTNEPDNPAQEQSAEAQRQAKPSDPESDVSSPVIINR